MKIRSKIAKALIFCAFLSTSSYVLAQANIDKFVQSSKYKLTKNFLDPDSAKFRNLEVRQWKGNEGNVLSLCGEVNGKNSMGAYTGYKKFAGEKVFKEDDYAYDFVMMTWDIQCGKETKLIKSIK